MSLARKLKLGPHYAIERFGISVALIVIAFVVIIVAATTFTLQANAQRDATQALYTSSFTTTGTGTSGTVNGIYRNSDGTRVAVLMQLSSMDSTSIDASKYSCTLSGVDGFGYLENVKSSPACGLYVYGDSGYMVFYLTNAEAFPRQKLALNVNMGLTLSGSSIKDTTATDSFTVQFNPGADGVTTSDSLDGDTFNPVSFHEETVTSKDEASLRKKLADDIGTMRTELSAISEYMDRVKSDGIVTDGMTPSWVSGDGISVKSDGSVSYSAATTLPNGLSFDWASCSIAGKSYIDTAMAAVGATDRDAFMLDLGTVETPTLDNVVWKLADGTDLATALTMDASNSRYQQADKDTTALEAAWVAYGATKAHYQGDHLKALLELEYQGEHIAETYTSTTTNDGTITVQK